MLNFKKSLFGSEDVKVDFTEVTFKGKTGVGDVQVTIPFEKLLEALNVEIGNVPAPTYVGPDEEEIAPAVELPKEPAKPVKGEFVAVLRKGISKLGKRPNGTGDWSVIATDMANEKRYNVIFPKAVVEALEGFEQMAERANASDDPVKLNLAATRTTEGNRTVYIVDEIKK